MIKIEKGKAPEFLSSEKVEIARERMRTFYASNREQKRYLFPFNKEIDIKLKEDLIEFMEKYSAKIGKEG